MAAEFIVDCNVMAVGLIGVGTGSSNDNTRLLPFMSSVNDITFGETLSAVYDCASMALAFVIANTGSERYVTSVKATVVIERYVLVCNLHNPKITLIPFRSVVDNVTVTVVPSGPAQILSVSVYICTADG